MKHGALPDRLRRMVEADHTPVRPLPPPGRRALALLIWIPAAVLLVVLGLGFREDRLELGLILTWAPLVGQAGIGLGLVTLALADIIPGLGSSRRAARALLLLGGLVLAGQAWLTSTAHSRAAHAEDMAAGLGCLVMETIVGLSAGAVVAILFRAARPIRVAWACFLAGAGTGLMAEGVYRLHCGVSSLDHVIPWHFGAVALLAVLAYATGRIWESRQNASWNQSC